MFSLSSNSAVRQLSAENEIWQIESTLRLLNWPFITHSLVDEDLYLKSILKTQRQYENVFAMRLFPGSFADLEKMAGPHQTSFTPNNPLLK